MKNSFIKVCGIQSLDEALGSIKAGANTIGLLLGLTHLANDEISPEAARGIVSELPDQIRTVMVTHLLDADEIANLAKAVGVSAVQVHDNLPVEGMQKLRKDLPSIELIKAVHVQDETAIEYAKKYETCSDMLLLDSRTKDRLGGTGLTHDWSISSRLIKTVNIPVILAGGLNPSNINEAIDAVSPAGIDANSGLENEDGSKSFKKIKAFATAGLRCQLP